MKKNVFKAMYGLTKEEAKGIVERMHDNRWTYSSVYKAYGRPSATKVAIEERIKRDGNDKGMEAGSYRVLSRNTFMFTCAYAFHNADDNGALWIHYETPSRTHEFPVNMDNI